MIIFDFTGARVIVGSVVVDVDVNVAGARIVGPESRTRHRIPYSHPVRFVEDLSEIHGQLGNIVNLSDHDGRVHEKRVVRHVQLGDIFWFGQVWNCGGPGFEELGAGDECGTGGDAIENESIDLSTFGHVPR